MKITFDDEDVKCASCGIDVRKGPTALLISEVTLHAVKPMQEGTYCSWECLAVFVNSRLGPAWNDIRERQKRKDHARENKT